MKHKRRNGFTIIEIAVVVVVIGIIASIALISFSQVQSDSRDQDRAADITAIKAALGAYYRDNNEYPAPCSDGVSCNASLLSAALTPEYMTSIPRDPKGTEYNYIYSPSYNRDAYGLRVQFEQTPGLCKTGVTVRSTWWSSVANCPEYMV